MKNTSENKARFFALYYGQRVLVYHEYHQETPVDRFDLIRSNDYLSLRSIESLTDEEVINCGKHMSDFFNCADIKLKVIRDRNKISLAAVTTNEKNLLLKIEVSNPYKLNLIGADYLRSIGILIPFMGLSTETIIEYGWAKLTPPSN